MHVRDERAFGSLGYLTSLIEASDAFYAELDLSALPGQAFDLRMPEDLSLRDLVSPKRWSRARGFVLAHYGFDLNEADHYYPLMVLQQITQDQLSDEFSVVLDMHLFQYAMAMGLKTGGLEDWTHQLGLIHSIPLEIQGRYLFDAIRRHSAFTRHLRKMVADYQLEAIHALYQRTRNNLGGMRKAMLYDRNQHMASGIFSQLGAGEQGFYCIGAAHLAGKGGVLQLLHKKGVKLRRIPLQGKLLVESS